jgi:hypothetical protein
LEDFVVRLIYDSGTTFLIKCKEEIYAFVAANERK